MEEGLALRSWAAVLHRPAVAPPSARSARVRAPDRGALPRAGARAEVRSRLALSLAAGASLPRLRSTGRRSGRRCRRLRRQAAGRAPCAEWGCSCGGDGSSYAYRTSEDYHQAHPAVKELADWRRAAGQPAPEVFQAASPAGYRTRKSLGVGPSQGPSHCIVGLFRRRSWEVVPAGGCAVNHPALEAAVAEVQAALDRLGAVVTPFDHSCREPWVLRAGALRHVELTVERSTGLVQLVLIWNGEPGDAHPGLDRLADELWQKGDGDGTGQEWRWHSIWVHWREPERVLARAIHSRRQDAWQQLRPVSAGASGVPAEVLETLDFVPSGRSHGRGDSIHPACFQQANLFVFERILRDMKTALRCLAPPSQPLRLLELCGGVGAIGLSLAHEAAQRGAADVSLLSTDLNPQNAGPFAANASRALAALPNCHAEFAAISAAEALTQLALPNGGSLGMPADVLVLDPPRRGLARDRYSVGIVGAKGGEEEAKAIRRCRGLRGILYMSCGYDSFMLDADRLTRAGDPERWGEPFRLETLACYDMFPFTAHIETLGVFVR